MADISPMRLDEALQRRAEEMPEPCRAHLMLMSDSCPKIERQIRAFIETLSSGAATTVRQLLIRDLEDHIERLRDAETQFGDLIEGKRQWDVSAARMVLDILDSYRHLRDTYLSPPQKDDGRD